MAQGVDGGNLLAFAAGFAVNGFGAGFGAGWFLVHRKIRIPAVARAGNLHGKIPFPRPGNREGQGHLGILLRIGDAAVGIHNVRMAGAGDGKLEAGGQPGQPEGFLPQSGRQQGELADKGRRVQDGRAGFKAVHVHISPGRGGILLAGHTDLQGVLPVCQCVCPEDFLLAQDGRAVHIHRALGCPVQDDLGDAPVGFLAGKAGNTGAGEGVFHIVAGDIAVAEGGVIGAGHGVAQRPAAALGAYGLVHLVHQRILPVVKGTGDPDGVHLHIGAVGSLVFLAGSPDLEGMLPCRQVIYAEHLYLGLGGGRITVHPAAGFAVDEDFGDAPVGRLAGDIGEPCAVKSETGRGSCRIGIGIGVAVDIDAARIVGPALAFVADGRLVVVVGVGAGGIVCAGDDDIQLPVGGILPVGHPKEQPHRHVDGRCGNVAVGIQNGRMAGFHDGKLEAAGEGRQGQAGLPRLGISHREACGQGVHVEEGGADGKGVHIHIGVAGGRVLLAGDHHPDGVLPFLQSVHGKDGLLAEGLGRIQVNRPLGYVVDEDFCNAPVVFPACDIGYT